jgi:peroxiredoxin
MISRTEAGRVPTLVCGLILALAAATAKGDAPSPDDAGAMPSALQEWRKTIAPLAEHPDDVDALKQALALARHWEQNPATVKFAIGAYRDLSALAGRSVVPELAAKAAGFAGIARRLNLPGHLLVIKGRQTDGAAFDSSNWRGKVVLVDFWATWCPSCRAELPNIQKNYARFHVRGFEVIGVSLDAKLDKLCDFLRRQSIPWPVLFSKSPSGHGWDIPLAVRYGVTRIPCAILIDQQGKVFSLNARGPELGRQLERLLGE